MLSVPDRGPSIIRDKACGLWIPAFAGMTVVVVLQVVLLVRVVVVVLVVVLVQVVVLAFAANMLVVAFGACRYGSACSPR
jgi:hypothetical protein